MHKPLHRYRRFHRTKRHSRFNGEFEEATDKNRNDDSVAVSKKNGRHCIQKKIDRLVEENRVRTMNLESSAINPGKFFSFFFNKNCIAAVIVYRSSRQMCEDMLKLSRQVDRSVLSMLRIKKKRKLA